MKKLAKSNKNRKICGVCGGIAEYLNLRMEFEYHSGLEAQLCAELLWNGDLSALAHCRCSHRLVLHNGKKYEIIMAEYGFSVKTPTAHPRWPRGLKNRAHRTRAGGRSGGEPGRVRTVL